jgi:hypothetical protein
MNSTLTRLQPGNYMKTTAVLQFLRLHPIEDMLANRFPKHIGDYDVYFNTEDLKTIMKKELFQEMECKCITHMILTPNC